MQRQFGKTARSNCSKGFKIWTDEDRYDVGKYTSKHGNAAAVRHFKKDFPNIKESTVKELKKKSEKQLQEAKKQNLQPKSIRKYSL